jgi:hypothetical protein
MHTSMKEAMEHEMCQCQAESTKGREGEENGGEENHFDAGGIYRRGKEWGEEILEN